MRRALVPAFLLLLGSTILGATVLREPLARAATPIASVFVTNDSTSPVPVREQNLDANGNLKMHEQGTAAVHEQGTADVNVTNSSLPVTAEPAARHFNSSFTRQAVFGFPPPIAVTPGILASLITIDVSCSNTSDSLSFTVRNGGDVVLRFLFRDGDGVVLPLPQPIAVDAIDGSISGGYGTQCTTQVNIVGS